MKMWTLVRAGAAAVCVAGVVMCGCASGGQRSRGAGDASQAQAMFERVKKLEGTWVMADEKGEMHTGVEYRVVSAGSAVCERMFPGSEHEMVNMYHLDGDRLLVTHYCAMGTQARMQADGWSTPTSIVFKPESVTNLSSASAEYMAKLELEMPDADHLTQKWTSQKEGVETHHTDFAMMRKK
ncbi:MAG TPA: hypothetical protein VK176_11395 [Phycisphaerales bacterium]|nr:hypothetical protein [Phycisphaerales bacterium]